LPLRKVTLTILKPKLKSPFIRTTLPSTARNSSRKICTNRSTNTLGHGAARPEGAAVDAIVATGATAAVIGAPAVAVPAAVHAVHDA
jgi:hypothetical protein